VAVVFYALSAALMSAPWLVFFAYLRRRPDLLRPNISAEYVRAQRFRPLTGLILYGLSAVLGWFVDPIVGLVGVIVMIIYHAVTSEGLRTAPLKRLPRRST
jgi:hypothetical protein